MMLFRGKTPLGVLECACSWELSAMEIGAELSAPMDRVYTALKKLRRAGFIEPHDHPRGWHRKVKPTRSGRAALAAHCKRWAR